MIIAVKCEDAHLIADALQLLRQISGKQLYKNEMSLKELVGPLTNDGSFLCGDHYGLWQWAGREVVGVASNLEKRKRACCLAMALELALEQTGQATLHCAPTVLVGIFETPLAAVAGFEVDAQPAKIQKSESQIIEEAMRTHVRHEHETKLKPIS